MDQKNRLFVNAASLFENAEQLKNAEETAVRALFDRAFEESAAAAAHFPLWVRERRDAEGEGWDPLFRTTLKRLAFLAPDTVKKLLPRLAGARIGHYDDLFCLFGTPCEKAAADRIRKEMLYEYGEVVKDDTACVSTLVRELPSPVTNDEEILRRVERLYGLLGVSSADYLEIRSRLLAAYREHMRIKPLSLRASRMRAQPASDPCALIGEALDCLKNRRGSERMEKLWADFASNGRGARGHIARGHIARTIVAADCAGDPAFRPTKGLAETAAALTAVCHAGKNEGHFAGRFLTFSAQPYLMRFPEGGVLTKAGYCMTRRGSPRLHLYAAFTAILDEAVRNRLPADELPERLLIVSDTEYSVRILPGSDRTDELRAMYSRSGYRMPEVVYWNADPWSEAFPVMTGVNGVRLVSGQNDVILRGMLAGKLSESAAVSSVLDSERYGGVCA